MRGLGVVFRQLSSMVQESPGGCSSAGFRQPSKVLPSNRSLNPACFSSGASVLSAASPVTQAAAAAAKKYLRFIAICPYFQASLNGPTISALPRITSCELGCGNLADRGQFV